ncbi:UNVERIFIED_CONTAM: hypothetical protein Sradi_7288900 [Sesamum radiatum]|uniref:Uncharacterized protein n=1 Tax=Sesamum radiatum TaxID=300843 RepID=A0AAW2II66_SESRA
MAPLIATNDRKCAGIHSKRQNFAAKVCHNGASPVVHVAELGESYACICSSGAAPPVRKVTPPGRLDVPRVAPR